MNYDIIEVNNIKGHTNIVNPSKPIGHGGMLVFCLVIPTVFTTKSFDLPSSAGPVSSHDCTKNV